MKTFDAVKIFLLGMITAFLAIIAVRGGSEASHAAGGLSGGGDLIAVTSDNKNSNLFLVNPVTKNIAYYVTKNDKMEYHGGRSYKYDIAIKDTIKSSNIDFKDAKKQAKKDAKDDD